MEDTVASDGYMGFVGVTTGASSIMRVFPAWADVLGLPTRRLVGHDIPLGAPPEVFRDVVTGISDDPKHHGALVTTHKMSVFEHSGDLFDELDELAVTFGEISSIAKRGPRLIGAAKDPVTVRLALEDFVAPDHFSRTGGAALILGSGGSGSALSHQLGVREDRPSRIICTARRQKSLDHLRSLHEAAGIDPATVEYALVRDTAETDALLAGLPDDSLVANATGLGKDRTGSPLSDAAVFPRRAIAWEFNYRGSLEFMHQAQAQGQQRELRIEDGWRYFVHGWSQVVADIFDIPMSSHTVDQLARVATDVRNQK